MEENENNVEGVELTPGAPLPENETEAGTDTSSEGTETTEPTGETPVDPETPAA
ncbi:MAG TPA: hypothetical protein VFM02_01400 [Candidatus Paceibacterota bacterium]|nr:hypothetical protein [Candidatus Paceibacterota bacterium]